MNTEEKIARQLAEKCGLGPERGRTPRARRIFFDLPAEALRPALETAGRELAFQRLVTITGLDEGDQLAFIHHLARADGIVLSLRTRAPKSDPVLPTVTDLFPGSEFYERELVDLLGARVAGLPPGPRYPLPDNWPAGQYPLRRDFQTAPPHPPEGTAHA